MRISQPHVSGCTSSGCMCSSLHIPPRVHYKPGPLHAAVHILPDPRIHQPSILQQSQPSSMRNSHARAHTRLCGKAQISSEAWHPSFRVSSRHENAWLLRRIACHFSPPVQRAHAHDPVAICRKVHICSHVRIICCSCVQCDIH
jgi:hypothetical protein